MTVWCGKCHCVFDSAREFSAHPCAIDGDKSAAAPAPAASSSGKAKR